MNRTLIDIGLGSMSLLLVMLTIFLSSGILSREIERRTIFLAVSQPISRGTFLAARLSGTMLTILVLLALMSTIYLAELLFYGVPVGAVTAVALGMLFVELLVVGTVGVLLSSCSGQLVSLFVSASVYLAGHLSGDIYRMALRSKAPALQAIGKATYYFLPNLDRLNFRPYVATNAMPPAGEVLSSAGYGLAYSAILLAVSVLVFQRRDFK